MKNLQVIVTAFLATYQTLYFSDYISPAYLLGILICPSGPSCLDLESSLLLFLDNYISFTWEKFKTETGFLEIKFRDMVFTMLNHYQIQCNFI